MNSPEQNNKLNYKHAYHSIMLSLNLVSSLLTSRYFNNKTKSINKCIAKSDRVGWAT